MQVIWAIGASMMVLAALQFLGRKACLALGALIVLGHNALDGRLAGDAGPARHQPAAVGGAARADVEGAGPFHFLFLYPLLPWIGVMLLGFGVAVLFEREPAAARSRVALLGLARSPRCSSCCASLDGYGDPNHWQAQARGAATLIDFLNTTKYPPSLLFLR